MAGASVTRGEFFESIDIGVVGTTEGTRGEFANADETDLSAGLAGANEPIGDFGPYFS